MTPHELPKKAGVELTPAELRMAGEGLYGEHWQTPLSRELGIATRMMRRWLSGKLAIPPHTGATVIGLCIDRYNKLRVVISLGPPA